MLIHSIACEKDPSAPHLRMRRELSAPFLRMRRKTSAPILRMRKRVSAPTLRMRRKTSAPFSACGEGLHTNSPHAERIRSALFGHLRIAERNRAEAIQEKCTSRPSPHKERSRAEAVQISALLGFHSLVYVSLSC